MKALPQQDLERLSAALTGTELQSLLLEVMRRRAKARSPSNVLSQHLTDAFCTPSPIDQRVSLEVDRHLLAAAEGFDAIELSPVAPLGACSSFATTDQNRVLSALRATEVVSDPTNVLALECAKRMRAGARDLHFTTSQRVIRAQPLPKTKGFERHFRIFVLASGGIEEKDHAFTVRTVVRHVRTMMAALDRLESNGYRFGARRIDVLATAEREALGDRIASELGASASRKELTHPYYSRGLRYQIWVTAPDGSEKPLIDGGAFDWLATLAQNRRAVFVASGAGAQLIPFMFGAGA
jgi:hypothetical protein